MEFLLGCSTRYLTSESDIELNTGREIPYQKENMYHFYHINTIALNRQENWTSDLGLRMVNALPFIHQPDSAARKAIEVSAADHD